MRETEAAVKKAILTVTGAVLLVATLGIYGTDVPPGNRDRPGERARIPRPAVEDDGGAVWPAAVNQLAAVAGDATLDPSVRVAAMAGLVRHADVAKRTGGDRLTEFTKGARPAILAIVAEQPSASQPVVSDWLMSRALSILTAVVKSSPKELATTLTGVMNDKSRSLDVRVRAAAALGATVTPKSEIQAVETTNGITELAVAVLEADEGILRDRRYEAQMSGGGSGGGPMGPGRPMMPGMPPGMPTMTGGAGGGVAVTQLIPDQVLRRTAWRLVTLADALLTEDGKSGVAALLSGDDKEASGEYAKLYRQYGLELDEKRSDDVILEALASLRPGDENEAAAAAAGELEGAPEKPADDNDPFGGK
jgi:hypothetical protein